MEEVECPVCHHRDADAVFSIPDWQSDLDQLFTWRRCRTCGLMYVSPRPEPDEIGHFYPQSYGAYKPVPQEEHSPLMRFVRRRNMAVRCNRIASLHPRPGRILDIGAATGGFLSEMRQRGWSAQGVELNAGAAEHARQRLGLDVLTGDLLQVDLPDHSFDVVTMWDVLEHVHDPVATLDRIHRLLRPSGILMVNLPDVASLDARLFGKYWIGYDTPRHLWAFPRSVLTRLFRQAGFSTPRFEHFLNGYYASLCSVDNCLVASPSRRKIRPQVMRILWIPGVRFPFSPWFWALNRLGLGSNLTAWSLAQ